jgi:hypothetical protein
LAILFKNYDPAPPEKKYSWEEEEDNVEDDGEQTEGDGTASKQSNSASGVDGEQR